MVSAQLERAEGEKCELIMFDIAGSGAMPVINLFRQAAYAHESQVAVLAFPPDEANWFFKNTGPIEEKPHSQTHLPAVYTQTHAQHLSYLDVVLDAVLVLAQALAFGPAMLHQHLFCPITHLAATDMVDPATQVRHPPLADKFHCFQLSRYVFPWVGRLLDRRGAGGM